MISMTDTQNMTIQRRSRSLVVLFIFLFTGVVCCTGQHDTIETIKGVSRAPTSSMIMKYHTREKRKKNKNQPSRRFRNHISPTPYLKHAPPTLYSTNDNHRAQQLQSTISRQALEKARKLQEDDSKKNVIKERGELKTQGVGIGASRVLKGAVAETSVGGGSRRKSLDVPIVDWSSWGKLWMDDASLGESRNAAVSKGRNDAGDPPVAEAARKIGLGGTTKKNDLPVSGIDKGGEATPVGGRVYDGGDGEGGKNHKGVDDEETEDDMSRGSPGGVRGVHVGRGGKIDNKGEEAIEEIDVSRGEATGGEGKAAKVQEKVQEEKKADDDGDGDGDGDMSREATPGGGPGVGVGGGKKEKEDDTSRGTSIGGDHGGGSGGAGGKNEEEEDEEDDDDDDDEKSRGATPDEGRRGAGGDSGGVGRRGRNRKVKDGNDNDVDDESEGEGEGEDEDAEDDVDEKSNTVEIAADPYVGEEALVNFNAASHDTPPTPAPTEDTEFPDTDEPTNIVTLEPTNLITVEPTNLVTVEPTNLVTVMPTSLVAVKPTNLVTLEPTALVIPNSEPVAPKPSTSPVAIKPSPTPSTLSRAGSGKCQLCADGRAASQMSRTLIGVQVSCQDIADLLAKADSASCSMTKDTLPLNIEAYCGCPGKTHAPSCRFCSDGKENIWKNISIPSLQNWTCQHVEDYAGFITNSSACAEISAISKVCCGTWEEYWSYGDDDRVR
jgi:hypothetical protein